MRHGYGQDIIAKMWINEIGKGCTSRCSEFKYYSGESVYYNSWENDFNSDALTPLIYIICRSLSAKANKTDGWGEAFKDKIMAIFRNQKADENNVVISTKEEMGRIMVASSLMYKLDETGY